MMTEAVDNTPIVYLTFEELLPIGDNTDKPALLNEIRGQFESGDWRLTMLATDSLRRINKSYPADMNTVCAAFWDQIIASVTNLRSAISKNSLLFVSELFEGSAGCKLNDRIISDLTPILLQKCYNDKYFLKSEAQKWVEVLTKNCLYDSLIIILCNESFNKNHLIAELSTKALARWIGFIGQQLPKLMPVTFRELFQTLAKVIKTRDTPYYPL